ncbi:MAG: hypothetical protein QOJ64_1589, partial [Acidobacteriota bacterium]|nr:hypothetical protein [Acidobacteriota bacterium]
AVSAAVGSEIGLFGHRDQIRDVKASLKFVAAVFLPNGRRVKGTNHVDSLRSCALRTGGEDQNRKDY